MSNRISVSALPFQFSERHSPFERGIWPVSWLAFPHNVLAPGVVAYRLVVSLPEAARVRVHISGDERYELWLGGKRLGRGPERSLTDFWAFDSYDLELQQGVNVLVARVQHLGKLAPSAQLSSVPGFLLAPEDPEWLDVLATGRALWEVKVLEGYSCAGAEGVLFTGAVFDVDGAEFAWGFEHGKGDGWERARVGERAIDERYRTDFGPRPLLRPAALPPQLSRRWERGQVRHVASFEGFPTAEIAVRGEDSLEDEVTAWQQLWSEGRALTIPAQTRRRVVVDLEDYVCGYPQLRVSGGAGALVRWHWQEALLEEVGSIRKGQRDAIEGKFFATPAAHSASGDGLGDIFRPDGGETRTFEPLHWRCGRFLEICIETGDEALVLDEMYVEETRFPLDNEGQFESSDARMAEVTPLLVRSMQMCAHETYMDCPFYEQLQYVGDTRLEVLTTYAMTRDDTLPRQALRAFDRSRLVGGSGNGLTQSRTPSRIRQVIPPFSLWWVAMVHDYSRWRDDAAFVREMLPGVRTVLDAFRGFLNEHGLVEAPPGWNFGDWARGENSQDYMGDLWPHGTPPQGQDGMSGLFNWQFALVLRMAAELEEHLGDELLAQRNRRDALAVAAATHDAFWNEERGLWADDLAHQNWSEHTQCLALLSDLAPEDAAARAGQGLASEPDLTRTTIYFSHYLLESFRATGNIGALMNRLESWFELPGQGFKTTPEQPEPTRSDCHAWGAHPLFHFHSSILGVRPVMPGFAHVEISPLLGDLTWAKGTTPHPRGEVRVHLEQNGPHWSADIELPDGVEGTLNWQGEKLPLYAGKQVWKGSRLEKEANSRDFVVATRLWRRHGNDPAPTGASA